MKGKAVPMIGLAVVFGGISIFVADWWLKNAEAARESELAQQLPDQGQPAIELNTIVVAAEPLRFGEPLRAEALREIPWPKEAVPTGAFTSIDELKKDGERLVLSPVEVNEPILLAKLSGPNGRGSLSNLLRPGMRAVSLGIDEVSGVGGFITPGDRVDVVLTRTESQKPAQDGALPEAAGVTSETVVRHAKVLSIGQGADERSTAPQLANSATLEVSAEDANRIAIARMEGQLSLVLRPAGETVSEHETADPVDTGLETASTTPEKPASTRLFKTVVVTRALKASGYRVPSTDGTGDATGPATPGPVAADADTKTTE